MSSAPVRELALSALALWHVHAVGRQPAYLMEEDIPVHVAPPENPRMGISLIAAGEVDPARVYVSGMSMGGAGTLRMLAHHRDLFSAAALICPSMNEETLPCMKGPMDLPLWVSCACREAFSTRHLRIVEGIEHWQAQGNRNPRYTLFTAEELAAYGLGCHPDLTEEQRWGKNHHS